MLDMQPLTRSTNALKDDFLLLHGRTWSTLPFLGRHPVFGDWLSQVGQTKLLWCVETIKFCSCLRGINKNMRKIFSLFLIPTVRGLMLLTQINGLHCLAWLS